MDLKGISPLIAVVLLVGITVTAAGVVMVFGRDKAEFATTFAEGELEAALVSESINLNLESASFLSPGGDQGSSQVTVELVVSNPEDSTSVVEEVLVVDVDGGILTVEIDPIEIAPGEIVSFQFSFTIDKEVFSFRIYPVELESEVVGRKLEFVPDSSVDVTIEEDEGTRDDDEEDLILALD